MYNRNTRALFFSVIVSTLIGLSGCGSGGSAPGNSTPGNSTPNFVHLQSDPGDFIGQGQTYSYTQADSVVRVTATGRHLTVSVAGDEDWTGDFGVPNTLSQIRAGTYTNLTRYAFSDPAVGGMDWYGEGRGSNTVTGTLVIDSVTYANGALSAIDLHFDQHSEGAGPALHGQIHWDARDTTKPANPVTIPPSGLWQPAPGSTPASGDYIYLESEAGDYIGAGRTYTYTSTNAQINLSVTGSHIRVYISGTEIWSGDFFSPITTPLGPGYYGGAQRYPFNNPVKNGLDWSGDGRGSNWLTGWFVIDNIQYLGTTLTALDLRFEQHSEGSSPALHGKIHWDL